MKRVLLAPACLALVACGAPSFEGRPTTASVAQSNDPWLAGPPCDDGTSAPEGRAARSTPGASPDEPRVQVLAEGTGAPVGAGETVRIHYVARDASGKVLHDTHDTNMPSEVIVGSTRAICGVMRALVGMRPGEQRRVDVPWPLAFGEAGRPPEIPPRADLSFVIDLYLPADVASEVRGRPGNPSGVSGGGRRR